MKIEFRIPAATLILGLAAISCAKEELPPAVDDSKLQKEFPVLTNVLEQGYYKDIFMEGGVRLTGRTTLPAANELELSLEFFATPSAQEKVGAIDSILQRDILDGNPNDLNGVLLYPDGSPRFSMIYMNGGQSSVHCRSITPEFNNGFCNARARIIQFYERGGSYVGTCAGAFMTSRYYDTNTSANKWYLNLCSVNTKHTGRNDVSMPLTVVPGNPLLKYNNFGGDGEIEPVYHNGGCFVEDGEFDFVIGAEKLLRYKATLADFPCSGNYEGKNIDINGKVACWAYKRDRNCGRMVAIGSHPEGVSSGERLDLMCSLIQYARDGRGYAIIKDTLENGKVCEMNKETFDPDSLHIRIGDLQNHHFAVWIGSGVKELNLTLVKDPSPEYEGVKLFLFAKRGMYAFDNDDDENLYHNNSREATKTLTIQNPERGLWYVCVYCDTTIDLEQISSQKPWKVVQNDKGADVTYYKYTGPNMAVLNGVPYTIRADWK